MTLVKICGLKEPARIAQACEAGADFVGFVFFPPSRRNVTPHEAGELARHVTGQTRTVGLFVNPDDHLLEAVLMSVALDVIQLHGEEKPERVAEIGLRFGVETLKALPVAVAEDLAVLPTYQEAADMLLFDAKALPGAAQPGGNGLAFDWRLLQGLEVGRPWLLAGGLSPDNVEAALAATGAPGVDVSSGVEISPGVKDPARLADFIAKAKGFGRNDR
ncbi:phosphoribosylanthranilate isomerase [Geminicoccus flavidas]|uniref:phosphoribosylanthranilate isomerase n=1 Tax=Geminicoccus flavidas TaxID=2506407 RepID=UPI00135A9E9F|nr:phosphoribosylanthranilate isomerase [Geminicoccus flavidas]